MCNDKTMPEAGAATPSPEAILKDALRWAALRDNGWTLYEVQTEVRIPNTSGIGPTYRKEYRRTGWTTSFMPNEEFDSQDEAIDAAIRIKAGAAGAAPAPGAVTPRLPLHADRILELAQEYRFELLHGGFEQHTIERMIYETVRAAEEAEKDKEDGPEFPPARPLDKGAVVELAREYLDTLLSNGVEEYYLKQLVVRALQLAYPSA